MKREKDVQKFEKELSQYRPVSGKNKEKINSVVKKAREKKSINLRINKHDLILLKKRAEQEGIPYQTLVSSILHKYLTEQLVEQKDIVKSVQLLKHAS